MRPQHLYPPATHTYTHTLVLMEAAPDALSPSSPSTSMSAERGSPAVRAAKDITFGSVRLLPFLPPHQSLLTFRPPRLQIAGIVSKFFEHPFDLTKVRLQAQVLDAAARFNGPLDCLVQTYKNEGVRGLYRVCRRHLISMPGHPHAALRVGLAGAYSRSDGGKRVAVLRVRRTPKRNTVGRGRIA